MHIDMYIQIYKQIHANKIKTVNISTLNVIDINSENINSMHLCISLNATAKFTIC